MPMKVRRVKDGLLIPEEYFRKFGEVEVIYKPFEIIIKPKTVTRHIAGISRSRVDVWDLIQDYEAEGEHCESESV